MGGKNADGECCSGGGGGGVGPQGITWLFIVRTSGCYGAPRGYW